jgi:hypothetical protein
LRHSRSKRRVKMSRCPPARTYIHSSEIKKSARLRLRQLRPSTARFGKRKAIEASPDTATKGRLGWRFAGSSGTRTSREFQNTQAIRIHVTAIIR